MVYFVVKIILTVFILVVVRQNFIAQMTRTAEYQRMQENIGLWKLGNSLFLFSRYFIYFNNKDVIVNMTVVNSYNCPEGY